MAVRYRNLFFISLPILLAFFCAGPTEAQIWKTGDNSTVEGCSSHCSVSSSSDLSCWQSTLSFFETSLISQLRHYIAVQVDIDQWHRRHGKPEGQKPEEVSSSIRDSFRSQLLPDDLLSQTTSDAVAKTLADRIIGISDGVLSSVPHFQCPLPCEYKHDMYRNLFIASIILNVALAVSVLPNLIRSLRNESDSLDESLIHNGSSTN